MSQATLERAREAYRVLGVGDARPLRELVDPEATWEPERHTQRRRSESGEELLDRWLYRARTHRLRVTEALDFGDKALLTIVGRRMGYMGARFFGRSIFQVVTFREGRIVRLQDFRTRDEALAALGVTAS